MKILVIGNVFDLAHSLPTKYSHFLDFVSDCIRYSSDEEQAFQIEHNQYFEETRQRYPELYDEYMELIANNRLLEHFLRIYKDRCRDGKEGWIDFENEIAYIIKSLEIALKEYLKQNEEGKEEISFRPQCVDRIVRELLLIGGEGSGYGIIVPESFKDGRVDAILGDLNRITRLLELYLVDYVENLEITCRLPEFENAEITHVLSFNYTDTYRKLYDPDRSAKYCYIQGFARGNESVDTCSLVLGVDESSLNACGDEDNTFVWFKKFYQRIYKETDSEYIDWLNEYERVQNAMPKASLPQVDLYIYGHSLDVTDRDALRYLILWPKMTTHIFYYNRRDFSEKVRNLVRVIGKEELIRRTRGRHRTIRFHTTGAFETINEDEEMGASIDTFSRYLD